MKLTLLSRNKQGNEEQMINLSCRTQLCRINNNFHDTLYLIKQLCKAYSIPYSQQFGSFCAHISLHYSNNPVLGSPKDLEVANLLINKFNLIFLSPKFINKAQSNECTFKSFLQVVQYGMKCMSQALEQDFVAPLNKHFSYYNRFKKISQRLLESLLLEFIPTQYSRVILGIYLEEKGKFQQQNWLENNKEKCQKLYPYQDLFQLMHSLSYHLIFNKKPVNLDHYLTLLENPLMGAVEWPMIIGARDNFDLPPLNE